METNMINELLLKIKANIEDLGSYINVPNNLYPTYNYSLDFAHPHIEVLNNGLLSYVIIEKGQDIKREYYPTVNELLYVVFKDITFSMATDFEIENRNIGKDFRRLLFAKQVELMSLLNTEWGLKCKNHVEKMIEIYPFNDQI